MKFNGIDMNNNTSFTSKVRCTTPNCFSVGTYLLYTKNGIHVRPAELAGSHNTSQKDTELLNSSAMDMTSVCIKCTQSHYMFLCFYVRQRTTSDYLRLTLHKIPLLLIIHKSVA